MDKQKIMVSDLRCWLRNLETAEPLKVVDCLDVIIKLAAEWRMKVLPEHGDILYFHEHPRYVLRNKSGKLVTYSSKGVVCMSERQTITALVGGIYVKRGNLFTGGYVLEPIEKEVS